MSIVLIICIILILLFGSGFLRTILAVLLMLLSAIVAAIVMLFARSADKDCSSEDLGVFYLELIAQIAKLDGRISEQEAEWISNELDENSQSIEHRARMKAAFEQAKNSPNEYLRTASRIQALKPSQKQRRYMLQALLRLALLDGLSQNKLNALSQIAATWRQSALLQTLLFHMGIHSQNRSYYRSQQPSMSRAKALERLGLAQGASMDEIKSAYRRLARKYHPDTLSAQGLSEEEIKQKTEKFREVNEAYEYLKNN